MNPVFIDKNYHVAPQIEPHQIAEIAEKGFVKIICNRPDVEVPEWYRSSVTVSYTHLRAHETR